MVSKPDTERCVNKEVEPRRGVDKRQCANEELGPRRGWIVRSQRMWEPLPSRHILKTLRGSPKMTISASGELGGTFVSYQSMYSRFNNLTLVQRSLCITRYRCYIFLNMINRYYLTQEILIGHSYHFILLTGRFRKQSIKHGTKLPHQWKESRKHQVQGDKRAKQPAVGSTYFPSAYSSQAPQDTLGRSLHYSASFCSPVAKHSTLPLPLN